MDESKWKEMESKYYMHAANRYPMVLEKGKGTKVWDTSGNEFLDFTCGWAVFNVGESNEIVQKLYYRLLMFFIQFLSLN